MAPRKLHIALLASPGMGHLSPVLLLGRRLVTEHDLLVTIFSVTTDTTVSPVQAELVSTVTRNIHLPIIPIPAADISKVANPNASVITQLNIMMRETVPVIRTAISSMDPRPDVLIFDIFAYASRVIAEEFGMSKFLFVTANAWFTALFTYSPVLDKEVVGQYIDQTGPLEIPGCKPVRPEDVIDPMVDRNDETYGFYLEQAVGATLTDGILINTWEVLEPQSVDALRNNEILRSVVKNKPVYTVGPIIKTGGVKSDVIEWLDKQPEESVTYVSFGSGGTISAKQIEELAWGLELSQQRFIWVVRPPCGHASDGSFFRPGDLDGPGCPTSFFPKGFLSRIQKVGFIVLSWAPQVEILNHKSVGGFLTHCGWNSTLESITSGVPMITWPLYAEQNMNATMLVEELEIAVRPEVLPTKKVVGRDEIEKMVRVLMDSEKGKEMREKAKILKKGAEEAITENGSSYISMCKLIENCWSKIQ
uniref:anthocyanidin 3-O-glucosyltransferase 5-like n=1 Tax=Erigeron canadensis TaxID=72917 RepID=UPI001CB8D3A7|nr:anthocyanidin 3-O-glucosyltransferase 5-like [Erigeron canadensis]